MVHMPYFLPLAILLEVRIISWNSSSCQICVLVYLAMPIFLAKAPERATRLGAWKISITVLYREMIWIARCGTMKDGTLANSKVLYSA
jgi:hypothetical protein